MECGRAFRVQSQNNVVLVPVATKAPGRMNVPFSLPLIRSQYFHRCFVARGKNDDGLQGIDPEVPKRVVKYLADLLKLVRNAPRIALTRIPLHHKVFTTPLHPGRAQVGAGSTWPGNGEGCQ